MPHVDYVRLGDAPEEVRSSIDHSAYADEEDRHLFYEVLANAPSIFEERVAYFRALMTEGIVDQRDKELAYFTVATLTDCVYPASTHGRYLVEDYGTDPETVAAIIRSEYDELNDRDRFLVKFTRRIIEDPTDLTSEHYEHLREIGFDDEAIVEFLMLINAADTAVTLTHALDVRLGDKGEQPPSYLPYEE
ncbi:carboxymuconolactone decarboxylase family protein [Halosolutus amylolyticus]|uniref:Carboxymuconolactone decarboxylase family protein n=1 Tax=Halosolutus amylolyticus TaxID=2932267 RepID=A0ABD5PIW9_9EURY|nr:carboxymuconolactone decarboxylase family protein [Halosolutus amylolyticus]